MAESALPVVMGDLNLARCFTLARIPFHGVAASGRRIFHSRACVGGTLVPEPAQDPKGAVDALLELAAGLGGRPPFFYSNDSHIRLLVDHGERLGSHFDMALPAAELLEAGIDKARFDAVAAQYRLPVPATYRDRAAFLASGREFPVILKPATRINWWESRMIRETFRKHFKVVLVESRDELERYADALEGEGIDYLLQQYVRGEESQIYSYHSFYSRDHRPLARYVGRKIRTYPLQHGQSSLLELERHDGIVELSEALLARLGFVGPIKIDYKIDAQSGEIYLLELNPRYNLWHYLGAMAGVNLPALACRYLRGEPVPVVEADYRRNVKWLDFRKDLRAYRELAHAGRITLLDWLGSLRGQRIYQSFSLSDPMPYLYTMTRRLVDRFAGERA